MSGDELLDERWARARRAYARASQQALATERGPAESNPALRVGDAERQAVVTQLQGHYVAGRLTSDELSERLDQAIAARTVSELRVPLRDLPAPIGPAVTAPSTHVWWTRLTSLPGLVLAAMLGLMLLAWFVWLPTLHLGVDGAPFLPVLFLGGFFFIGRSPRRS
jgi:hypothetical protein